MNLNPMKGTEKKALETVGKSLMEEFDKLIKTTNQLIEKVNVLTESHQRICDYLDDKIVEVKQAKKECSVECDAELTEQNDKEENGIKTTNQPSE